MEGDTPCNEILNRLVKEKGDVNNKARACVKENLVPDFPAEGKC